MKQCYLCGISSNIEEVGDGFFVQCTGPCGPYIVTRIALNDLANTPGRKQGAIDRVKVLRMQDRERRIRISHDSVSFVR